MLPEMWEDHELKDCEKYVFSLRRHFHRFPELSGQEKETSAKIASELQKMGIRVRQVGRFGIIGELEGALPGKTLVLRSDMDALPVQESSFNLLKEKMVISEREGVAHICGHDGHMAMLLGAAKLLSLRQKQLKGRVLFCFEEGAEKVIGLQAMMDALARERVDGAWGLYLESALPTGSFVVEAGPRLAGAIGFQITVYGEGGHGSRPDKTINPIDCCAQIVGDVQGMIAREITPYENVILSFGKIEGGSTTNIIPDTCTMSGTMRFFDQNVGLCLQSSFEHWVTHIATAHRCQVSIDFFGRGMPVVNQPADVARAREAIRQAGIVVDHNLSLSPQMRSDTFGSYIEDFTGVFVFLGINNPELGMGADSYTRKYDLDEACLMQGTLATLAYTKQFLEEE
ncbi:M20 metallopeptidase family protein [Paenibacillus sanguinis]|uniref:M20 metallopeptidase family protein n=1 Tax=Paenibacillus sanguinis TaxID=225906 RepID=UPI00036680FF|nr:amidohydrolase [Paenibacillus sanguinis]